MTATCPACGAPLPADAPAGLCPHCLLIGGLETSASPPAEDFTPPTITELAPLFPQFEIIEMLGAGGMGAVYKARQPHLDRFVALKVLPPRNDSTFAERFTREARTLAKLNHPGIVHVYDFGQAGGHSYIVMEYVEGVNLRQAERAGKMIPAEALAVVPQICAALQFAHEAGIVHRDIKPENILLDSKGRVKIADFGLAKLLNAAGPQNLTGTHQAMGTLHYMAPEQWEKPATVDHRADIYSLGVVFYELLTGELPLGRFAPPSEKARTDVRLDEVVMRTLEKEPERRYQHAGDVRTDVERIQATAPEPISLVTVRPARTVAKPNVFLWFVLPAAPIIGLAVAAWVGRSYALDSLAAAVALVGSPLLILGNVLAWVDWRRQRPDLIYSITLWAIVICVAGAASAFLPWVQISGIPLVFLNLTVVVSGFELGNPHLGKVIGGLFLVLAIAIAITARAPAMRRWGPRVLVAGAILVLIVWGYFFATADSHPKAVGQTTIGDKTTEVSQRIDAFLLPSAYVPPILALLLLALAATELNGWPVEYAGHGGYEGSPAAPPGPKSPPPLP